MTATFGIVVGMAIGMAIGWAARHTYAMHRVRLHMKAQQEQARFDAAVAAEVARREGRG